jgi:hypothetical protein
MSDGEYHVYVGLLAVSGLALAVLAVRGFDQRGFTRVVDALFGVAFLGYAALLAVADPAPALSRAGYGLVLVPAVLLLHMRRQRRKARARRFAAGFTPEMYVRTAAPTPLTPFPPPPPPLGSAPAADGPTTGRGDGPPPSGLSGLSNLPPPTLPPTTWVAPTPGSRPPMPSGLPAAPASGPPAPLPGLHGLTPAPPSPAQAAGRPAETPAAEPDGPGGSPVPGWHRQAGHGRHEDPGEHQPGRAGPGRHAGAPEPPPHDTPAAGYNTPYGERSPGHGSGGRPGDYGAADRYSNYDPAERFGTYEPPEAGEAWNPDAYAGHDTHAENAHLYETTSRLRQPAWLSSYPAEPADDTPAEPADEPKENGRHSRGDPRQPGDWPPRHD